MLTILPDCLQRHLGPPTTGTRWQVTERYIERVVQLLSFDSLCSDAPQSHV